MKRIQRQIIMGTKRIDDMTKEEAKQLAMLIDTEGTIVASTRGKDRSLYVTVRVGMSGNIPVYMAGSWGGALFKKYRTKYDNYVYTWRPHRRDLRSFLLKIKPYLLQKQKQAELAIKFLDIQKKKDEGYKNRLQELRMKISELNQARAPDIDITKLEGAIRKDES